MAGKRGHYAFFIACFFFFPTQLWLSDLHQKEKKKKSVFGHLHFGFVCESSKWRRGRADTYFAINLSFCSCWHIWDHFSFFFFLRDEQAPHPKATPECRMAEKGAVELMLDFGHVSFDVVNHLLTFPASYCSSKNSWKCSLLAQHRSGMEQPVQSFFLSLTLPLLQPLFSPTASHSRCSVTSALLREGL